MKQKIGYLDNSIAEINFNHFLADFPIISIEDSAERVAVSVMVWSAFGTSDIDPDEWDQTIRVNLNGMFYCLKEAIPLLKNSDTPSIINIASSASFFGFPLRSPYTAAKWAVIGLTKTLAMELGSSGIRVNAICPGSVRGDRIDRVIEADAKEQGKTIEEIEELYLTQVSMKTFVEPADVANLAMFLSSKAGRYISGQAIGLDGHTEGLSNNL